MKSLLLTLAALIVGCILTAEASAQLILNPNAGTVESSGSFSSSATQPTTYELRCRGASRDQNTTPSFSKLSSRPSTNGNSIITMAMDFERGSNPAGARGEGLRPGQCAWVDRQYNGLEPTRIRFDTSASAQLSQILHGSAVDRSPTAAERYPDQQTIPEYMSDSEHFWVFYAYNTNQGYLQAVDHQHWKPSGISRDQIIVRPNGGISNGPVISIDDGGIHINPNDRVGDVINNGGILLALPRQVYEPTLQNHQVRVLVRFPKEYGSVINYGGNSIGVCNAFSIMGATVFEPVPGGFGNDREVGQSYVRHSGPISYGNSWLCPATIDNLPYDRDLKVYIRVHPQEIWRTGVWSGGSNVQPPPGYERSITPGFQPVRLTASKPNDLVIFDMVYAPLPSVPR